MHLSAPMLGAYDYNVYVFLMDSSLGYYEVSFWVSFYGLCFEVYFSLMLSIATPAFFSCPFAWNVFSQLFTFSLCSLLFCRQHMCGSCFLIHSATLCLLIGAFNPFTLKVIINRYLFIAILLPSYLFFSLSLFFFLFLQHPCRADLEEVYSFSLLLSGKLLILPSILIESLAG